MRKQSQLELLDLTLFAAVVEQRSFSGAARASGVAVSVASKRVSRLEELLGARLLERTTRRVFPTDAGAAFYTHAARILSDLVAAENEVATLGGKPRGVLRVSAPLNLGEHVLAPLLPAFLARHPAVRIELVLSDQFVNLLAERFDVALRVGALTDSSLVRVKVGVAPGIVVAAPSYLARAGTPETPHDLARHNCLRFSNVTAAREWRFRGKRGGEVAVPVITNLDVNHGGAILQAVLAGAGLARLPEFMVSSELATGRLVRVLDDYAIPPSGIHLVHPAGVKPLPKVEVFVKELGAALKDRLRR